jgi:hypothetical protein
MIFHQRSLLLTFQSRVSFCARFPSHGFGAHISPFVAPRTLGALCYEWEYDIVDVLLFPWNALRSIALPLPFSGTLFVIYLGFDHVGALKRHRMCAILN